MQSTRKVSLAVAAFGALMLAIAILLITARPELPQANVFQPSSSILLHGVWNTRTVAEDNINGAYSGQIRFSPNAYEVRNDVVHTPIRMEEVHYELNGQEIAVWIKGNKATPTRIRMLSPSRATVQFSANDTMLYMYKQTP